MLKFFKQIDGGRAIATQLLIGNSYSTPPQDEVNFVLTKYNGKVKIFANMAVSTQTAFGQNRKIQMRDNNAFFNEIQSFLNEIKLDVEGQIKGSSNKDSVVETKKIYSDDKKIDLGQEFYVSVSSKPTRFPHRIHQDIKIACEVCHAANLAKEMMTGKSSGHTYCVGCHKERFDSGTTCSTCH